MIDEMTAAAEAGVELFVVDAGWYLGAGKGNDFASGLGSWQVDPARFPDGLASLREYAHSLGMQFGLWVEPERVNRSTVGKPQLAQEAWLATNNGSYKSPATPQICFGSAAARQWILELHARGPWPRSHGWQLRPRQRALRGARGASRPLSGPAHRELLTGRQPG
jgi:hypothetical protein